MPRSLRGISFAIIFNYQPLPFHRQLLFSMQNQKTYAVITSTTTITVISFWRRTYGTVSIWRHYANPCCTVCINAAKHPETNINREPLY